MGDKKHGQEAALRWTVSPQNSRVEVRNVIWQSRHRRRKWWMWGHSEAGWAPSPMWLMSRQKECHAKVRVMLPQASNHQERGWGNEHQLTEAMELRKEHGSNCTPCHLVWELRGRWPLAWTVASRLVVEPVTWGRSKCLAEVSGWLHLLLPPYLHGLSLYHRRKLNWSGTICSSKSHAGCYPVRYVLLGDCKLIILMIYLSNFPGTVF